MALHVCTCGYSTDVKCNYTRHTKKCKEYAEPDLDNKFIELQKKYEQELARVKQEYEEKLQKRTDKMRAIIASVKARYKYKRIVKDQEELRLKLMKKCDKFDLEYEGDYSLNKLRDIVNKHLAIR